MLMAAHPFSPYLYCLRQISNTYVDYELLFASFFFVFDRSEGTEFIDD